jgi:hypothetical protein
MAGASQAICRWLRRIITIIISFSSFFDKTPCSTTSTAAVEHNESLPGQNGPFNFLCKSMKRSDEHP